MIGVLKKHKRAIGGFAIRKPAFKPCFYFQRQVLSALSGDENQIGAGCDFCGFASDGRVIEILEATPGDLKIEFGMENLFEGVAEANGCVARRIVLVKDDYGANPGSRPRLRIST